MDIRKFLAEYASFKSVSCDAFREIEMQRTRNFLIEFLSKCGLNAREIKTDRHGIVLAKNDHKDGRKSVLLYGHYDVQPEGDGWSSDPFTLVEREGRLYARGASDNKGGNSTILAALFDIFTEKLNMPLNIAVVLEGEEEIGSPSMAKFLREYSDELKADFAVVADTWSIDDENIVITTALRGIVGLELKLKAAEHSIHSGYGGSIINPIRELAKLCASLHNEHGTVNVQNFYDDVEPPSDFELTQTRLLPFKDDAFLKSLGVKKLSADHDPYAAIDAMRFAPSLEFHGIAGGYTGTGIKTAIPSEASVKMTCRLVSNQNCEKIKDCLRKTILARIDKHLDVELNFEKSSNAYNLMSSSKNSNAIGNGLKVAEQEIESVFGRKPLCLRDGGSIPLIPMIKNILGIDSILIGLSSTKDNIHAADESISVRMLERGREFFKRFLIKLSC